MWANSSCRHSFQTNSLVWLLFYYQSFFAQRIRILRNSGGPQDEVKNGMLTKIDAALNWIPSVDGLPKIPVFPNRIYATHLLSEVETVSSTKDAKLFEWFFNSMQPLLQRYELCEIKMPQNKWLSFVLQCDILFNVNGVGQNGKKRIIRVFYEYLTNNPDNTLQHATKVVGDNEVHAWKANIGFAGTSQWCGCIQ